MAYPESLRDPHPRSAGYPLKRGRLDEALASAGVERLDLIYFLRMGGVADWKVGNSQDVLRADFRASTQHAPERIEVRVRVVPNNARAGIEAELTATVDRVAQWIRTAETRDSAWRASDHSIVISWDGSAVTVGEG